MAGISMKRGRYFFIIFVIAASSFSCGKLDEKISGISPEYIMNQFFESWRRKDWKSLYALTHPSLIQKIRLQKLTSEEQGMSDEDLFIRHFDLASKRNSDKSLVSYKIKSISAYKPGDTTVWADTIVNGRRKRIPLTLDGLTLKIDLTRIE
jgi:hypothetical protein